MKIGIVLDYYLNSGGGENFVNSELEIIKNLEKNQLDKFKFYYITTNKEAYKFLKNKNYETIFFNPNSLLNRFSLFLNTIDSIRKFVFKFKLNFFKNFLNKYKINFLIFVTPSKLVFFCRHIDFVSTIWEIQYKYYPHLAEYKNIYFDLKDRDDISKFISLYAFRIFVGTTKSKDEFSKFYNCEKSRIVEKLTQSMIVNKAKAQSIKPKKNILEEYLFYPAQFWSHKNHLYIVEAFKEFKKKNLDVKCIFTGSDKGHLKKIKEKIKEYNLENYFKFYEYLSDEEIIELYVNCTAVVIPTVVGTFTFPHIEAFFFEKIVFSATENLDKSFKERVINIDLNYPKSLIDNFLKLKENKDKSKSMIVSNKNFYNENLSFDINIDIYKKLLDQYMSNVKK